MNHLKSYKIFESEKVNILLQTIKDILLPISDMGYEPSVKDNTVDRGPFVKDPTELIIRVVTYTDETLEITNDVSDEFNRLNDYLVSNGYTMSVNYETGGNYQKSVSYNDFISSIKIVRNLLFVAKKRS